jgi:hypothetical protein
MSNGVAYGANLSNSFFTNEQTAFGSPYNQWLGKWWGWWFGIPKDIHPLAHNYDSKTCSDNQHGPVWFLYDLQNDFNKDGAVKVDCSVPYGKGIMIPITTTICDRGLNADEPNLASCANNIETPLSQMEVSVDRVRIDVANLKAQTGEFNITFPEDFCNECFGTNQIPRPGSYYGAYATGYFLLLHNASLGMHEIDLKVTDILKPNQVQPTRGGHFNIEVVQPKSN